ncbi:MAG: DUF4974 domain-containing protein [Bacteroidales bacterium]|jgi:ferric-dicitrate binding protein FerR (iron transport regulator)|nr:DUF4974 domain-containing protein [Bacteroidales bacterium]
MDNRTNILLAHYFCGEATDDELQQLDTWLAESKEHEDYFEQMTFLYRKTSPARSMPSPDMEKALASYKNYMQQSMQPPAKRHPLKCVFLTGIAAAIALLLGVFLFVDIETETHDTILKADYKDTSYQLSPYCEVALFKGSRIVYNKETVDTIKLFGKATFNINSKNGESILVQAGKTFIKDIGTRFTVTAFHPEEKIKVEVMEGEVLFYSSEGSGIGLKKNETGYFNTLKNLFSQVKVNPHEIVSELEEDNEEDEMLLSSTEEELKDDEKQNEEQLFSNMTFHSASLDKVVKELKDRFHVDIIFEDKSLRKLRINAEFCSNAQSIDEILEVIAETLSVQISKHGKVYVIS